MGHGGFGASVSNGGKLPPQKVLGELHYLKGALWRRKRKRGILEVLGLGGARKALNWTEPTEKASWAGPAETKESWTGPAAKASWAGPAETKESWAGPAETKESWAGPTGERTLRAPGT